MLFAPGLPPLSPTTPVSIVLISYVGLIAGLAVVVSIIHDLVVDKLRRDKEADGLTNRDNGKSPGRQSP